MKLPSLIGAVVAAAVVGGCTTAKEAFWGSTPEQVWTALVAAAETPDYESDPDVTRRWHVQQNDVVTFPEDARIEIFRRVQRVLHTERVRPQHESRTWRFRVTLASTTPPRAKFVSRGVAVPAHAVDEAKRYFDDVWDLLGGRPEPEEPQDSSEPLEQPESMEPIEPPAEPMPPLAPSAADEQPEPEVDIDELAPD